MDRLLGIIRSGGDLTARLIRQRVAPDFDSCEAVTRGAAESDPWYEIVEQPLETLAAGLFPKKQNLLAAWQTLGEVREQPPKVLFALRMVLAETILGTPTSSVLPLPVQASDRKVKPTAAHPRAYQGTIDKPPKEKKPALSDLRPLLCSVGRLELMPKEEERLASEASQPLLFRTSLGYLVRQLGEVDLGDVLALYWALGLDRSPARLAAVAYLFSLQCTPNTRDWCRFVAVLPEELRTPLLCLLIASGAYAANVETLPPSFAEQLAEVLGGPDSLYRGYWLLRGLTVGIAPEYLLMGYHLADTYTQSYRFHMVQKSGFVPLSTFHRYAAHCRPVDDFYAGMLLRLWEQCGLRPGLGECLEKAELTRYTPEVTWRCLLLYGTSWDNWGDLSEEQADAKWRAARPQMAALQSTLQSVPPEFQEKCVRHLIEYLWQWDKPAELQTNLSSAFALTQRLCRPPFAKKSDPCEVAVDFLAELSPTLRERFLNASDTSYQRLEKACRRQNDTWLLGRGTWALTRQAEEFSVRCFEDCPIHFFKVAKLLGCLSSPVREAIAGEFAATETTQDTRRGLESLEQSALHALTQGLPSKEKTSADRHALQLQGIITENRRALRKFLEAYWVGKTSYQRDHPLTRRWLEKHRCLNLSIWLGGISGEGMTGEWGKVSLRVETDPLEALKLGTYVGSCLGLGGSFAYSAAAAVLDINKQVVYAPRHTRNRDRAAAYRCLGARPTGLLRSISFGRTATPESPVR